MNTTCSPQNPSHSFPFTERRVGDMKPGDLSLPGCCSVACSFCRTAWGGAVIFLKVEPVLSARPSLNSRALGMSSLSEYLLVTLLGERLLLDCGQGSAGSIAWIQLSWPTCYENLWSWLHTNPGFRVLFCDIICTEQICTLFRHTLIL